VLRDPRRPLSKSQVTVAVALQWFRKIQGGRSSIGITIPSVTIQTTSSIAKHRSSIAFFTWDRSYAVPFDDATGKFFSYLFLSTNQTKLFKRQEGDNELNDRKMQGLEDIESPANRHDLRLDPSICSFSLLTFVNDYRYHDNTRTTNHDDDEQTAVDTVTCHLPSTSSRCIASRAVSGALRKPKLRAKPCQGNHPFETGLWLGMRGYSPTEGTVFSIARTTSTVACL
jgi:hypothetical protein